MAAELELLSRETPQFTNSSTTRESSHRTTNSEIEIGRTSREPNRARAVVMGCLPCFSCCYGADTDDPDEDIGQAYTLTGGRPPTPIPQDPGGGGIRRQLPQAIEGESPRFRANSITPSIVTGGAHVRARSEPAPIRTKVKSQGGGSALASQHHQQAHHIRLHRRVGSEGLEREPLIAKGSASSSYQPESTATDLMYTKNVAIKSPAHKRNQSILSEDEECCPTCLEEFTEDNPRIKLECAHDFHLACIYAWLERSETCPICSKPMKFTESI